MPTKISVRDYLTGWLKDYVKTRLKARTYEGYASNINTHIIPAIGNLQLRKLRSRDIEKFYNKMLESGRVDGKGGLSAKTVVQIHRILHRALNQAYRDELISKNLLP